MIDGRLREPLTDEQLLVCGTDRMALTWDERVRLDKLRQKSKFKHLRTWRHKELEKRRSSP